MKAVQDYNVLTHDFPTNITANLVDCEVKPNFAVADKKMLAAPPQGRFRQSRSYSSNLVEAWGTVGAGIAAADQVVDLKGSVAEAAALAVQERQGNGDEHNPALGPSSVDDAMAGTARFLTKRIGYDQGGNRGEREAACRLDSLCRGRSAANYQIAESAVD